MLLIDLMNGFGGLFCTLSLGGLTVYFSEAAYAPFKKERQME
jgi:hypothetical protein